VGRSLAAVPIGATTQLARLVRSPSVDRMSEALTHLWDAAVWAALLAWTCRTAVRTGSNMALTDAATLCLVLNR